MSGAEKLMAVFVSTHETLRAERAFKEERIKVRATIKPRAISSNCQMAITFAPAERRRVAAVVERERLDLVGYYRTGANDRWEVAPVET